MLKRLLLGLVLGCLMGGLAAAALVKGLGLTTFADAGGPIVAYLAALVTGALTGLVAGKPIWAKGAQIEALLKAFFGALLGAGAMFALRKWVQFPLDLAAVSAGSGALSELPAASLPLIGSVLGAFYGLDNDDPPDAGQRGPAHVVAEGASRKARVGSGEAAPAEADEASGPEGRSAQKRR